MSNEPDRMRGVMERLDEVAARLGAVERRLSRLEFESHRAVQLERDAAAEMATLVAAEPARDVVKTPGETVETSFEVAPSVVGEVIVPPPLPVMSEMGEADVRTEPAPLETRFTKAFEARTAEVSTSSESDEIPFPPPGVTDEAAMGVRAVRADPKSGPLSLERLIGGKFYLVAGSIVVVIGVGLFLKLGYDAGWFRMAPMWKCLWGAAFGFALLGAGEVARRRVSVFASAGVSSAGMGALFAATYAAHGLYDLIGPMVAFALLAVVTAIGIGVSIRARLLSVTLLSLVGGYLAPFLLEARTPNPYVLPLHLMALLTVGLVLSAWREKPFRPLRSVVWWATLALGSFWLVFQASSRAELGVVFLAFVWIAVHMELMVSARRGDARVTTPEAEGDAARRPLLEWHVVRPVGVSFSTSAWCALIGVFLLRWAPVLPDWFVPAGILCGAAALSMMLVGNLRLLRDAPSNDSERLGAGLVAQAGAMLIAVVALAFQGWLELSAWLAVGFAATAAAAWVRSKGLGVYGVVILCIALGRLVTYDAFVLRGTLTGTNVMGLVVDRWTLLSALTALAWGSSTVFLATLGRGSWAPWCRRLVRLTDEDGNARFEGDGTGSPWEMLSGWDVLVRIVAVASVVLLFGTFIHPLNNNAALATAWIVLSMGLLAAQGSSGLRKVGVAAVAGSEAAEAAAGDASVEATEGEGIRSSAMPEPIFSTTPHPHFFGTMSFLGLAATTILWLMVFVSRDWAFTARNATVHRGFLVAVALTGAFLAVAWLFRRGRREERAIDPHAGMAIVFGVGVAWCALSLETLRIASNLGASGSASGGWMALTWIALAACVDLLRRVTRWNVLSYATAAVLFAGAVAWGRAYLPEGWSGTGVGYAVHPGLLVAVAFVAALIVWARMQASPKRRVGAPELAESAALVAGVALAWTAISLETLRVAETMGVERPARVGWMIVAWVVVAALVDVLRRWMRWNVLLNLTMGILVIGALVATVSYLRPSWPVTSGGYLVHPGLGIAGLLVAALLGVGMLIRRSVPGYDWMKDSRLALCVVVSALLAFGATSFETARQAKVMFSDSTVQLAAVSIWWGVVAASLLVAGFVKRFAPARYLGLGLLGIATAKAVIVDLADVPPIWRVVSVLGLGLLMLAVAVAYAKVSDALLGDPKERPSPGA